LGYDLIKNELYWGENYDLILEVRPSEDLSEKITIWGEKYKTAEDKLRVPKAFKIL